MSTRTRHQPWFGARRSAHEPAPGSLADHIATVGIDAFRALLETKVREIEGWAEETIDQYVITTRYERTLTDCRREKCPSCGVWGRAWRLPPGYVLSCAACGDEWEFTEAGPDTQG